MAKGPREARDTSHRSSAPLHPGAGSGPGKGRILDNMGDPTLSVSNNANVRADGFLSPPTKNESPAIKKTYPATNP
jgi:hypothetical protein